MNRREFGWALGAWFGWTALRGKQETVTCEIQALDAQSFREFALRERVKVDLGVPDMPKTGRITGIEERFRGELAEVRYRVDLDGPRRLRLWVPQDSVKGKV